MRLPPGYVEIRTDDGVAFTLPEAGDWVGEALARGGLHVAAGLEAEHTLTGRGPVHVIRAADRRLAIRHYYRGGAVARLLDDRHLALGEPRPLRELRASEAARRRGIRTPRVVAGAVYPAGIFYRADLVTEYIAPARDLAEILLREDSRSERRDALRAAGHLIARMAAMGLRHPDLNARNVLLTSAEGTTEALLIDLDRCAVEPSGGRTSPAPMVERLLRSLRKIARGREDGPGEEQLEALATELRHAVESAGG